MYLKDVTFDRAYLVNVDGESLTGLSGPLLGRTVARKELEGTGAKLVELSEEEGRAFVVQMAEAFEAYAYHYPRKKARAMGGGGVAAILDCGHMGTLGAPCCKSCADKKINEVVTG